MRSVAVSLVTAISTYLAPHAAVAAEKVDALAKGPAYAIHVFEGAILDHENRPRVNRTGIVITHVNLSTGEMTCLLSTGAFTTGDVKDEGQVVKLLGILQDESRLVLLVFRGREAGRGGYSGLPEVLWDEGTFQVEVFSKLSGERIAGVRLDGRIDRGAPPVETTDAGLITAIDGGFAVFGVEFKFTDDERVIRRK